MSLSHSYMITKMLCFVCVCVCVCVCMCVCERERQTDTHTHTHTERASEQEREREREKERKINQHTHHPTFCISFLTPSSVEESSDFSLLRMSTMSCSVLLRCASPFSVFTSPSRSLYFLLTSSSVFFASSAVVCTVAMLTSKLHAALCDSVVSASRMSHFCICSQSVSSNKS